MILPRVYLSGPIRNTLDHDHEWRFWVKGFLNRKYEIIDPFRNDYRNTVFNTVNSMDVVQEDLRDINSSHIVLASCDKPGWGTAMEIFHAKSKEIPVIAFCDKNPSPWLLAHARVVPKLTDAIKILISTRKQIVDCFGLN